MDKKRKQHNNKHILTLFMILILVIGAIIFISPIVFNDTRAIMVDGKTFAIIKAGDMDTDSFNLLLAAKLKERYGKNVEINEEIILKPTHAPKKNIALNVDVVIANLCDNLSFKGECGAIMVNGEQKYLLKSVNEAESVLSDILAYYTPKSDEDETEKTEEPEVSVEFIDDITVEPFFAEDEKVVSYKQAFDGLTEKQEKVYDYVVKKGDAFNGIATSLGMTDSELLALNPDITEKTKTMLQIGQVLKVKAYVPVYGVYTILNEVVEENVQPPVEEIENLSRHKSYTKEISAGKAGKKQVTYKVYYENGIEIKREPIENGEKIIVEPEPRKIEVGVLESTEEVNSSVGNFIYPIKSDGYFSSGFGSRDYGSGRHFGIDIAASAGTKVYASDGGVVTEAGWNNGGYGNWVVIDHGNNFKTIYAHNSLVLVRKGQMVHQGELLALVGSTGDSTGNHLHFEIRLKNKPFDPLQFLA